MKKILAVLIVVLLAWNSFLTYKLCFDNPESTQNITKVETVVSRYTTDITKVVNEQESKICGVKSLVNNTDKRAGSGVIYDVQDDYAIIVTNYHIVDGSTNILVEFANDVELEATLIGSDEYSDLAVLKVPIDFKVEKISLGDSSLVKKGEYTIVIGNPLGLDDSVTYGIISGVDRRVSFDTNHDGYADWDMALIQTDAAINSGNSGGALLNMSGELIGITSLRLKNNYGSSIGFAIPINEVERIVQQLIKQQEIIRPSLGIVTTDVSELTTYQKSYLGIPFDIISGIVVNDVLEESPAALAGLTKGDVITMFNTEKINNSSSYRNILYSLKPEDKVLITYLRQGELKTIEVVLA